MGKKAGLAGFSLVGDCWTKIVKCYQVEKDEEKDEKRLAGE